MANIEVRNVSKLYHNVHRDHVALQDVSLRFSEGSFTILMGTSGVGKTTLLNLIAGFLKPTSGEIFVNDENIASFSRAKQCAYRQKNLGMIFQDDELLPFHSVKENILLPMYLGSFEFQETQLLTLANSLGIEQLLSAYPDELSGGERQRVGIARAFVHHPNIILADEPTGNLDKENTIQFMELLKEFHERYHTTIILATHDELVASYGQVIIKL